MPLKQRTKHGCALKVYIRRATQIHVLFLTLKLINSDIYLNFCVLGTVKIL